MNHERSFISSLFLVVLAACVFTYSAAPANANPLPEWEANEPKERRCVSSALFPIESGCVDERRESKQSLKKPTLTMTKTPTLFEQFEAQQKAFEAKLPAALSFLPAEYVSQVMLELVQAYHDGRTAGIEITKEHIGPTAPRIRLQTLPAGDPITEKDLIAAARSCGKDASQIRVSTAEPANS